MESKSLQFADIPVEVEVYHHDFLILRSGDADALGRIGRAIFLRKLEFVEEVIVTEAEVLLKLNPRFSPSQLSLLEALEIPPATDAQTFHLPVYFEVGSDWDIVLEQTGLGKAELIERLCGAQYSVAMLGFLPGFAYLDGLPAELQVPRKAVPEKHVEVGSVAIGGKYLGLYALESPGGWNVIGKTPLRILQIPHLPPVPFLPGDQFRIQPIDAAEFERLQASETTLNDRHARP
jgi:KipI family sensor histidine kinase inhibitor